MKKIKIGKRFIGKDNKTYIIAEIAGNHNHDLPTAFKLIDEVKKTGADAVKFQLYQADRITLKDPNDPLPETYDYFKSVETPVSWIPKLFAYARKNDLEFLCTPFDPEAVAVLDKIGMSAFKIASGDVTNTRLLKLVAKTHKPILLSTGMSYLSEVATAVQTIIKEKNKQILLLHCVSLYPTLDQDVNLRVLNTLQKEFDCLVGWSDHTPGIAISVAAVAMGATMIEKHVTLSRNQPGLDHHFALEMHEFKQMVKEIRRVEKALGDRVKKPVKGEFIERTWARRAIYPLVDIPKGTRFKENMLDTLRPNEGIPASDFYNLLGKKAKRNIKAKHKLSAKDFA
ncbi:hypothetical protein C4564_00685 [Candidatus Microgenomates bacterium]|nr:MAG: hypothetical protein C4564_00685 [Candidatus Microgenomates bacterium]